MERQVMLTDRALLGRFLGAAPAELLKRPVHERHPLSTITHRTHLPHIFGPSGYTLVDDVAKLPYRVSDSYRRMTS